MAEANRRAEEASAEVEKIMSMSEEQLEDALKQAQKEGAELACAGKPKN